MHIRRGP
ncbi:uncharacterized protein FTOL_13991 [Fusarium torulosum]|nr:uncharacterized protein FTOL_13991 [Fusarium torulosum]